MDRVSGWTSNASTTLTALHLDYRAAETQDGKFTRKSVLSGYEDNNSSLVSLVTSNIPFGSMFAKGFKALARPRETAKAIKKAPAYVRRLRSWMSQVEHLMKIAGRWKHKFGKLFDAFDLFKKISGAVEKFNDAVSKHKKNPRDMTHKAATLAGSVRSRVRGALVKGEHTLGHGLGVKAHDADRWLLAQRAQIGLTLHQGAALLAKASRSISVAAAGLAKTGGRMLLAAPFRVLSLTLGAASAAARMWHAVTTSGGRGQGKKPLGAAQGKETQEAKRLALALASVEHSGTRAVSEAGAILRHAPSLLGGDPHTVFHLHTAMSLLTSLPRTGLGSLFQDPRSDRPLEHRRPRAQGRQRAGLARNSGSPACRPASEPHRPSSLPCRVRCACGRCLRTVGYGGAACDADFGESARPAGRPARLARQGRSGACG